MRSFLRHTKSEIGNMQWVSNNKMSQDDITCQNSKMSLLVFGTPPMNKCLDFFQPSQGGINSTSFDDLSGHFGFPNVNFHWSSDVPRFQSYGIYIAQLVRFDRCF